MQEDGRHHSCQLQEKIELRDIKAEDLREEELVMANDPKNELPEYDNMTLGDMLDAGPSIPMTTMSDDGFLMSVREGYTSDTLFKLVVSSPDEYKQFTMNDGLIFMHNRSGAEVLCIPCAKHNAQSLQGIILDQAHWALGYHGFQWMSEYTCRWYWWPQMVSDVKEFCKTCTECQQCKGNTTQLSGKLHSLPILVKPWDSIGMDFIGLFPEVMTDSGIKYNYLWVIVCCMTSMVHLTGVHTTMTTHQLSVIYMREIVRLHGLPSSIVSDRDSKFTSKWWRELHRILGAQLLMSMTFHLQTDGLTEHTNRSIGQIFHAGLRLDQKDWFGKIDLTEFAINASVSDTTKYVPFKVNSGYMPSMICKVHNPGMVALGIWSFAQTALCNLADTHDAIIESRVFQTHQANKRQRDTPIIAVGDLVYLSMKNLNMPKGHTRKLCPKFVGPYKVQSAIPDSTNYTLELPAALRWCRIHPNFHVSLLRPYHTNNDMLFPNQAHPEPYNFGTPDDAEWFVDEIVGHH